MSILFHSPFEIGTFHEHIGFAAYQYKGRWISVFQRDGFPLPNILLAKTLPKKQRDCNFSINFSADTVEPAKCKILSAC
ncbi:hypothetical protein [Bartonella sp. B10834G3]|uniref:hypothetical protein n=1 Tax=Bartonella sp. B10834G3 TaxID=2750928 RepID=UPI00098EC412|nr:hypothetical protein [Bartonella sp. B10834G3]